MKTKSMTLMITMIGLGLAGTLSASPRSKHVGPSDSAKSSASHTASSAGHLHLKVGPKSK